MENNLNKFEQKEETYFNHNCPKNLPLPKRCATCETLFSEFENEFDKLKQSISDFSNSEFEHIKTYFKNAHVLLEETSLDYNQRLHEAVSHAKEDIDLRVESLTTDLDIRDLMFKNLDTQENILQE